jgi:hypothetical protein
VNRSQFLRLSTLGAAAFAFRPRWAMGEINYVFEGTPAGLRPYLQTPRPDSIWVSWWTDADTQTHVDFGTSAGNLDQTASGTVNTLGANYRYHSVRLTALQPDTYYYYRARTENVTSQVFRFRTPKALGTATGKFRVLVIGDNQIIDPAQRRYERLVERAKKKIEDLYGGPIEEVLDLVLMPGDQVDVGTLEHYRHLHFKFCGWISPHVPVMTTIGNHETYSDPGLANYKAIFRYDDLTCLGVASPDPEVYYAYQMANIAFVHTSSEHTGSTQTAWVQNLVGAANAASGLDWMISLCHRPYQAEQYIGDISNWLRTTAMPILGQTEKHVLNIGAHHHIYARGQTRQWPAYHIISGGSAWDQYWGQSSESNYDDVQKTIANWAWQLIEFDLTARTMDVRCFAEANVRFPLATRWSYNSRLIDQFSRKLGLPAPATPALTNATATTTPLPYLLQSSAYATTSGEALNTTWFQVATDAAFSNVVLDRVRDAENIYGDTGSPNFEPVDVNAGVDILKCQLEANSLQDGTYHARVRHRDTNTLWSAWSSAITFTVQGSTLTGNPAIRMANVVYAPNEDYQVIFENGPGVRTDWVGIYKKGQTPGSGAGTVPSTDWFYLNNSRTAPATAIRNGALNFTQNLAQGEWFAAFFTNDAWTEIAPRVPFFVGSKPVISANKTAYDEGEVVQVAFSNAPGAGSDWIGIYKEGTVPDTQQAAAWNYLNGTRTAGTTVITGGTLSFAGLEKGYYYADYFVNGGYLGISERIRFSVGSQITQISMVSGTVQEGEDFTVNFSEGPGTPKDWIGIFKVGETPGVDVLTAYLYVAGATQGSVTFHLPDLPPGDYFLALFINDSYTEVSNRFLFNVAGKPALEFEEAKLEGNQIRLRWKSESGKTYRIQRSTHLNGWEDVRSVTASSTSHEELLAVDRFNQPSCFFRVTDQ